MIHIKAPQQRELFDAWRFISPKRRKLPEKSWASLFQRELLSELPVDKVARFFSENLGRPIKELHTMLGVSIPRKSAGHSTGRRPVESEVATRTGYPPSLRQRARLDLPLTCRLNSTHSQAEIERDLPGAIDAARKEVGL